MGSEAHCRHGFHDFLMVFAIQFHLLVPPTLVPDFKAVEGAGQEDFLTQPCVISQNGRDQDSPLVVEGAFLGTGNEVSLEVLLLGINQRETRCLLFDLAPELRGKCDQTWAPLGDDEGIRIVLLQDLAKFRGNAESPFGIEAMDRLSSEVGLGQNRHFFPQISTYSHLGLSITLQNALSNLNVGFS